MLPNSRFLIFQTQDLRLPGVDKEQFSERKWRAHKAAMYAAHKVHESHIAWQPWMLDLVPEYGVMPDRKRHMLDACGTRFPFDDRKHVLRLDQSKPGMKEGCAPTITPGGTFWVSHKGRTMMGREKLALQGLFVQDSVIEQLGDRCLSDLAGNAFCSANCIVALLVVLCGLGRGCDIKAGESSCANFDPFEQCCGSESD